MAYFPANQGILLAQKGIGHPGETAVRVVLMANRNVPDELASAGSQSAGLAAQF